MEQTLFSLQAQETQTVASNREQGTSRLTSLLDIAMNCHLTCTTIFSQKAKKNERHVNASAMVPGKKKCH